MTWHNSRERWPASQMSGCLRVFKRFIFGQQTTHRQDKVNFSLSSHPQEPYNRPLDLGILLPEGIPGENQPLLRKLLPGLGLHHSLTHNGSWETTSITMTPQRHACKKEVSAKKCGSQPAKIPLIGSRIGPGVRHAMSERTKNAAKRKKVVRSGRITTKGKSQRRKIKSNSKRKHDLFIKH